MQDLRLRALYDAFRSGADRASAMEQFLVASGAKQSALVRAETPRLEFRDLTEDTEGSITLVVVRPGYCFLSVKAEGAFIRLTEQSVPAEALRGGSAVFRFMIDASRLHEGRNDGKIRFIAGAFRFSVPVTVLWVVLITNAVNLIDGLDGLAAGVSVISSVCLLVVALGYSDMTVAVICSALAGSCIGFLPYNISPARIFMGDTGSTFIGFILAVASIQGLFKIYALISFAVPFFMLGLPIFDVCFAVISRVSHGESPMKADRKHVHYRLLDMGLTKQQTVAVLYIVSGILGLVAVLLSTSDGIRWLPLVVAVIVFGYVAHQFYRHRRAVLKGDNRKKQDAHTGKKEDAK